MNLPRVLNKFVPFDGGTDEETPPLRMKPGMAYSSENFEQDINGGYSRIEGYERFDGQPAPSDATYTTITINMTGTVAVDDAITGNNSSATAVVIAIGEANAYLALTKVVGTFVTGEDLLVSAVAQATATAGPITGGASTSQLDAQYYNLAADAYRSDIAAMTGSGPVLGVWMYNDVVYAIRNAVGDATANMWKSTANGWAAVDLGYELAFTAGGTYTIAEGDVIVGNTSTANATVTRVVLTSGAWADSNAAGKLIFTTQNNNFTAEVLDVGANLGVANIAGNSTDLTLLPDGRWEFINHNFGGGVTTKRMYGADGVNRAFEFDGTVFVPIDTGMTTDTPLHITAHKNQLFLSFGASVQHAAPGTPYIWSALLNASEIALGDTVTNFKSMPGTESGGALMITTKNTSKILYGSGVSTWNLVTYSDDVGGYDYTIQSPGTTLFFDDIGLISLQAAQEFGNFTATGITDGFKSFVQTNRSLTVGSCLMRDKNQYRIFFSGGYGLFLTLEKGRVRGAMKVLFTDVPTCLCFGETSAGKAKAYFGASDGIVYEMEKGTSFDGDAIYAFLDIAYNFTSGPRVINRYRHASLETRGLGYTEFSFSYDVDYATTLKEQVGGTTKTVSLSAVNWDDFTWDAFVWDGATLTPEELSMDGSGENVSLKIITNGDYFYPIRFTGANIAYSPRRLKR